MRPILERLGTYLPAAVALAIPILFIPNANDEFHPAAGIRRHHRRLLGHGAGPVVARRTRSRIAPATAACGRCCRLLSFAFSVSWPLSMAGALHTIRVFAGSG